MTRFLVLLLSAAVLSLSACKKDPLDSLPEATQTGANTVGWLQDGQAYKPTTDAFNSTPVHAGRFSRRSRFLLSLTHNQGKRSRFIVFSIPYLRGPGLYALNQVANPTFTTSTPAYGHYETSRPELSGQYLTGPAATGQVLITRFDSVAQIISGTFEFTAQKTSGEGPETVRITDGRFDLSFEQ